VKEQKSRKNSPLFKKIVFTKPFYSQTIDFVKNIRELYQSENDQRVAHL
jgi:hypothetical protein